MEKKHLYRNYLVKSVYGFSVTTLTLGSSISTMMIVSYAYNIYLSDINNLKKAVIFFFGKDFIYRILTYR
jgi:hypothetical protein